LWGRKTFEKVFLPHTPIFQNFYEKVSAGGTGRTGLQVSGKLFATPPEVGESSDGMKKEVPLYKVISVGIQAYAHSTNVQSLQSENR